MAWQKAQYDTPLCVPSSTTSDGRNAVTRKSAKGVCSVHADSGPMRWTADPARRKASNAKTGETESMTALRRKGRQIDPGPESSRPKATLPNFSEPADEAG